MPNYKQWRLPAVRTQHGELEIRINQGLLGFDCEYADTPVTASEIITLDQSSQIVLSVGPLKRAMNNEDGKVTVDQVTIDLRDRYSYSGISNSVAVSEDLGALQTSLLNKIFKEEVIDGSPVIYEVWLAHTVNGETEIVFVGDCVGLTIPYEHKLLHKAGTSDEEQYQVAKITLNFILERLANKKIEDLLGVITSGHCVNDLFYAGNRVAEDPTSALSWVARYDASGLQTDSNAFPYGTWGISISQILNLIAGLVKATAFNSIESSFRYYHQKWNGQHYNIETDYHTGDSLYLCYNYLFGKSVVNGIPATEYFTYPCSITKEEPLTEFIKWVCYQFGAYIGYEINYIPGATQVYLKIIPRRKNIGSLPSNFQLQKSKEEPRQISKDCVTITNRGDDTKVIAGKVGKSSINIELAWRAHQWGESTGNYSSSPNSSVPLQARIWNRKFIYREQSKCFQIEDRDDNGNSTNQPSEDGWIGGAMLYWYSNTNPSLYHPGVQYGSGSAPDKGFYSVAMALPNEWSIPGDKNGGDYYNTTKSAAQWYYQELIGNKSIVTREYIGCLDDTNKVRGITLGIQTSFRLRGKVRTYRAVDVEQDIIKNTTKVKWLELPDGNDYDTLARAEVTFQSEGKSSSGGGGSSSSSNPTVTNGSYGNYIARKPIAATESTIRNQAAGQVTFSLQAYDSQTADHFQLLDSLGTTVISKITADGKFHSPATTSGDSNDTLVTKGFADTNYTPPTNYIRTDPSTSAQNKILPTSTNAVPLTIQKRVSQASDLIEFYDSDGTTLIAWMDVNGKWYIPSTSGGDIGKTAASKDYVDNLFASVSGFVVLSPSNNSINVVKPAAGSVTNIRLQGNLSGTSNNVLTFEDGTTTRGGVDSFGRGFFGVAPSSISTQLSVKGKDNTYIPLAITEGPNNSGTADLFQVNSNAGFTYFHITKTGEFQGFRGTSFGIATKTANFTLDDTAVLWSVSTTSGAVTATLPVAADYPGRFYIIERTTGGANNVTIGRSTNPSTGNADTIARFAVNKALGAAGATITLISDGVSNWAVV